MEVFITIFFIAFGVCVVYLILRSLFRSPAPNNPDSTDAYPYTGLPENITQPDSSDENRHVIHQNHDHHHGTHSHHETHTHLSDDRGSDHSHFDSGDSTSFSDSGTSSSFD